MTWATQYHEVTAPWGLMPSLNFYHSSFQAKDCFLWASFPRVYLCNIISIGSDILFEKKSSHGQINVGNPLLDEVSWHQDISELIMYHELCVYILGISKGGIMLTKHFTTDHLVMKLLVDYILTTSFGKCWLREHSRDGFTSCPQILTVKQFAKCFPHIFFSF